MQLIYEKTNEPVKTGDVAHTFDGEAVVVTGWRAPHHAGSTGRVYVRSMDDRGWETEFYPSVINAKWVGRDDG
jgi:hypothetical protein